MAIEIVDFPIKNGGSFQFAMLNNQRVELWLVDVFLFFDFPMRPVGQVHPRTFWTRDLEVVSLVL